MFTLRTGTDLTARDIRRLERHGYAILAAEPTAKHEAEKAEAATQAGRGA